MVIEGTTNFLERIVDLDVSETINTSLGAHTYSPMTFLPLLFQIIHRRFKLVEIFLHRVLKNFDCFCPCRLG